MIDWDAREIAVARLALSQLSYATDTGAERGVIAEMLADLRAEAEAGADARIGSDEGAEPDRSS